MPQPTVAPSKMAEQIAADQAHLIKKLETAVRYAYMVSGEAVVSNAGMLVSEAIRQGAYDKLFPEEVEMKEES